MTSKCLKLIALITMIIDHFAASVIYGLIVVGKHRELVNTYYIMRHIGRVAFPIYCFLLVEGYYYTKNIKKYILSMLIFAFVSEIPFDLALEHNGPISWAHQNVYFTLLFGLLTMLFMDKALALFPEGDFRGYFISGIVIALMTAISYFARMDYKGVGVFVIAVMHLMYRSYRMYFSNSLPQHFFFFNVVLIATAILIINSKTEIWSLAAAFLAVFYNGKKGNIKYKYFYYVAYPLHLIIFAGIIYAMGIAHK